MNGTVSRNGSSQFSDAYSCDFKQLDLSNLCRKVAKIRVFAFLEVEKRVPPIFAKSRKTCTPYFYEKFHKNRYLIFFM